ncbi:DUF58 domain-containing protein [Chloroflexota bacterium]
MNLSSEATEIKPVDEGGESSPSRPVGYLLGKFGLLAILAGLLLAAWSGQIVIVIMLGLLLSAAGLSKLWSRLSLAAVSCERRLSERRVFPGEYTELTLKLSNRKLLPLPWIQVDDELPLGFSGGVALSPGHRPGFGLLSKGAALLWYTGVSWKQRLKCDRRGYFPLGPVTVTSGDIFGFYPHSVTEAMTEHIIVYPEIFPIDRLGIPSMSPIGDVTAERRIFEDPARVIGVRDYSPHDSRRRIHWKATARHQQLQVKVFEPTTTLKVALFLAVDSFEAGESGRGGEDVFELGVSAVASVASYLVERRSAVGLYTNSRLADSGQTVSLPPGSSGSQLVEILEALAKVTTLSGVAFEEFLQAERASLPWGTTLVLVISTISPSLEQVLAELKESGRKILVIQVGSGDGGKLDNTIPWHHIMEPGDLMKLGARGAA